MARIPVDTIERLRAAGFSQEQVDAILHVVGSAQPDLVTKEDLKQSLEQHRAALRPELSTLKWSSLIMLFVVVLIFSLVLYDTLRVKRDRVPFKYASPPSSHTATTPA